LRMRDSPLQVTMWSKRVRAVDFTIGYEVRSVRKGADSKPAVIAETQLAAVHIKEQRLERLSPAQRDYLQRYLRRRHLSAASGSTTPPTARTWRRSPSTRPGSTRLP
jgi:hypothetical protein